MVAVAMVLVWAGYGLGLFGWTLFEDYDVTLGQMMSPVHPYSGAWPPAKIPAGQTWPGGNKSTPAPAAGIASPASEQAAVSAASRTAEIMRWLDQILP